MSKEAKILIAILVLVVGGMIGLFALANGGDKTADTTKPTDAGKLARDDSHKIGTGAVQIVEFGDFQCPACGAAEPRLAKLRADYDGKVNFVFRNFPLAQIHKNAVAAANAAESAGAQGKYWEMHDKLYANQTEWSDLSNPADKFAEYATSIGIDGTKVKKAIQDKAYQQFIDTDMADGEALQVNSTPTVFIDGKKLSANDYETMKAAVETALNK